MLMSDFFTPIGQILPFKAHLGFTSFSNRESNSNKSGTPLLPTLFILLRGRGGGGMGVVRLMYTYQKETALEQGTTDGRQSIAAMLIENS